ncbi:hypothetical protein LXL04_027740 [Taraxacum kok-saghyz]
MHKRRTMLRLHRETSVRLRLENEIDYVSWELVLCNRASLLICKYLELELELELLGSGGSGTGTGITKSGSKSKNSGSDLFLYDFDLFVYDLLQFVIKVYVVKRQKRPVPVPTSSEQVQFQFQKFRIWSDQFQIPKPGIRQFQIQIQKKRPSTWFAHP